MYKIVVLNNHGDSRGVADAVGRAGMACRVEDSGDFLWEDDNPDTPDAVVVDLASLEISEAKRAVGRCRERKVPVVAAVPREAVGDYDPALNPDELVICPVSEDELSLRVSQAVYRVNGPTNSQALSIGDLSIDLERYEVSVAGRRVTLTYKEFQLLALLASNPGRVYTQGSVAEPGVGIRLPRRHPHSGCPREAVALQSGVARAFLRGDHLERRLQV